MDYLDRCSSSFVDVGGFTGFGECLWKIILRGSLTYIVG